MVPVVSGFGWRLPVVLYVRVESRSWSSTCPELQVNLDDGAQYTGPVEFR